MKRWIRRFIVTVMVLVGTVWFYDNCYLPEFEIVSTIKTGTDNFTYVALQVKVNRWRYDRNEILEKANIYYCDLNGKPNVLDIKLI